jgi:hypothetical protein
VVFVFEIAHGIDRGRLDRLAFGPAVSLAWNAAAAAAYRESRSSRSCRGAPRDDHPSMSHLEETLLRRWSGKRTLLASGMLALLGVGPLLLYVLLGPADGNPVGLGLLAVASAPFAVGGAVIGIIKLLVEFFSSARR